MLARVAVDAVIGAIPLFGDVFDLGYQANRRNVETVRRHLRNRAPRPD